MKKIIALVLLVFFFVALTAVPKWFFTMQIQGTPNAGIDVFAVIDSIETAMENTFTGGEIENLTFTQVWELNPSTRFINCQFAWDMPYTENTPENMTSIYNIVKAYFDPNPIVNLNGNVSVGD